MAKKQKGEKVRIIALGGVDAIGRNITVLEYGNDLIIVDCGISFPEDNMLGVDSVIPDFTYLVNNADKIRGLVLTHGHEDHIGAVPYLLQKLNVPVYGTRLTLGILEGKLKEFGLLRNASLNEVNAGETITLGAMSVEFIHVNHSISDSVALCITTPCGRIIHTGDFKIDLTPIMDITPINLARFAELGAKGVKLLLCDSTNADEEGYTPSELAVSGTFDRMFATSENRIIVATFSSNVHRVQQIINYSAKYGRKIAVTGRSMVNVVEAATRLGYMTIPDGALIDVNDVKRYAPDKVTIITTGSQGEPMSALYRMAYGAHQQLNVGKGDTVVLSASSIPGNEKLIGNITNELCKRGVRIVTDDTERVHVSGHACREEIKIIHALTNPEYFMPVHGEYHHLAAHTELARLMGMKDDRMFIPETGRVYELSSKKLRRTEEVVQAGQVLVDGSGVGDVGSSVLRDRKRLSEDGIIVVSLVYISYTGEICCGPEIDTRGFVYAKESEDLIDEMKETVRRTVDKSLEKRVADSDVIKNRVSEALAGFVTSKTKRRPMIIVFASNIEQ